ncbi:hypothetical protein EBT31_00515 [bacterium]|nr:hypothetical protein [bacterium]NBX48777.1 hypothetical protein [bacterium]
MAKYSAKVMGKEVGQASTYAEPHTMAGAKLNINSVVSKKTGAECMNEMNMSVGGISKGNFPAEKTSGIKIRGTGAATKGVMARGPMG